MFLFNTMNLISIKNILFKKEYQLYELLKLKKSLENRFLRNQSKLSDKDVKFKFKCVLITRKASFLFKNEIVDLIKKIEIQLSENFSTFKNTGKDFEIKSISSLNQASTPRFFDQLISYNTLLEKHNSNLIIQGSYSDGTQTGYSDVDLVIIGVLTNEIIAIKKLIEQDLLEIDPLQHHGVFFINKNSFSDYWLMDLPIETLKKALVFSRSSSLIINNASYFIERYSSFNWVSDFIKRYPSLPISLNSGVFFAKRFLSELMLIPVLALAAHGIYIYKRDSFVLGQKYYSTKAWECVEIVSSIRKQWNQNNISSRYSSLRKGLTGYEVKEYNYLNEIIDFSEQQLLEFSNSYNVFVEETDKLLINLKNDF